MAPRIDRALEGVQRWAARLAERRAAARAADGDREPARDAEHPAASPGPGASGDAAEEPGARAGEGGGAEPVRVPLPPTYAPAIAARPEPPAVIPWGMRVAAEAGWRLLVLAGVVWVLMKIVSTISLLIIAFSAGLLITALLQPTVARLRRLGLGRGPSTLITFVGGFVVMGLVGWFVVWQVMENLPTLTDRVQDGIEELKRWAIDGPFHVSEAQINNIAQNVSDWLGDNSQEVTSAGLEGVTVVFEFLSGALLAAFVTLFLLYDGPRIWAWTLKFVPAAARGGVAGAGPRAWVTLTGYVRGTVIVAFIDAVFIGIGIYFLDVPMAVPLAVFIFLFAFVPIVGAVVSGALAVLVALVTNGVVTALLVLAVVLAVQQLEGHVLQPFILGRMVRVHPLAVVLAVTGGSLIAGIPGAVVAVPLVAVSNTAIGYLRRYAHEHALASAAAASAGAEPPGERATRAEARREAPPTGHGDADPPRLS
ncbi:AI-2E family transporter [Streptomyces sp. JJ36]|uniref:AI-2E family transporter n=1 Tax=Streptomyces sp. JJ36 TaxID=2736645 RepID=UPI001F365B43|nr:AI-2E family transporter [Streptomyces sp. JJ36]MCF6522016.1 AI-2E family transporter [Streptomyces sp. JJ36]